MVVPAMQLASKIPDMSVQLWSSALLKGMSFYMMLHICSYICYFTVETQARQALFFIVGRLDFATIF